MSQDISYSHFLQVREEKSSHAIRLTGGGRADIGPGAEYPPSDLPGVHRFDWSRGRRCPEFQLMLVTDGTGEFDSEATGQVKIEGATLIFLCPGVWHRFRPSPLVGWTERWLTFSGDSISQLFGNSSPHPLREIATFTNPDGVISQFDALLDQLSTRPNGLHEVAAAGSLKTILNVFFHGAVESSTIGGQVLTAAERCQQDPIIRRALDIIWSEGNRPMSVSDIARQLPVTRRTLDRRFSEVLGHTVLDEINNCRLCRAKRLLCETDLPVKTVAHLAGFNSSERMRVLFIQREGRSPSDYRRHMAAARSCDSVSLDREESIMSTDS